MSAEWFSRLADAGVEYTPPIPIDRARLPDHGKVPEVHSYKNEDGSLHEFLDWGWKKPVAGSGVDWEAESANAPVYEHLIPLLANEVATSAQLLRRLWESLELPGQPDDYHRALDRVRDRLWSRKRDEPELLQSIEMLSWIDVRLVLAYPDTVVRHPMEGGRLYIGAPSFSTLIELYLTEGFLREALEVAELEQPLSEEDREVTDIRERLAAIASESAS